MARKLTFLFCLIAGASAAVAAADLTPATAAAFDRYARLTEQRINAEVARTAGFLWIDTLPESRRAEVLRGLQQGGVIIERLQTLDGSKEIDGAGRPHPSLGRDGVRAAGRRQRSSGDDAGLRSPLAHTSRRRSPASKLLEHDGNRFRVALRFHVKKIISVTMDTENEAEFFHPGRRPRAQPHPQHAGGGNRRCGDAPGKPMPAGEENGFMWNLNTYWRFLERDGGTYIQCESLTLTRDVPFALAWIIRPIVTQMPKESLTFTLAKAREALVKPN